MEGKIEMTLEEYNKAISIARKCFNESVEMLNELMNVTIVSDNEKILLENVRNNLPAWRDELLPIIMELDENGKETGNYERNSVFRHILDNHTWNRRIRILLCTDQVIDGDDEQGIVGILPTFKLSATQYRPIRDSIRNKLMANQKLTSAETKIVEYVLHVNNKSLFPKGMSDRHVYKTIQEAYADTKKTWSIQTSYENDKEHPGEKIPRRMMKYQGKSEKMIIEFDFDVISKTIQTAYPVYGKGIK